MSIYSVPRILDEIKSVAEQLFERNWAEKNAGNFSIRLLDEYNPPNNAEESHSILFGTTFQALRNQHLLMKSSGAKMRDIAKNPKSGTGLLIISSDGESGKYFPLMENCQHTKPSSELLSHLNIQEYLASHSPSMNCVLHTHPLETIVFSHLMKEKSITELNQILLSMHAEIPMLFPSGVGFIPFLEPGSLELAKASVAGLEQHSVLIWEKHGCLSIGKNLSDTYDSIDIINKGCSIYLRLKRPSILEGC